MDSLHKFGIFANIFLRKIKIFMKLNTLTLDNSLLLCQCLLFKSKILDRKKSC